MPWQCRAYLAGQLKRSQSDEQGKRQLFFRCSDGTLFAVVHIGRDDNRSLLWMFCHIEQIFNETNTWCVYPQTLRSGVTAVVPVAVVKDQLVEVDTLQFNASVGNVDRANVPDFLPLYVGRNLGRGHHFVHLTIPSAYDLPKLSKGIRIAGKAQRAGDRWRLQALEVL